MKQNHDSSLPPIIAACMAWANRHMHSFIVLASLVFCMIVLVLRSTVLQPASDVVSAQESAEMLQMVQCLSCSTNAARRIKTRLLAFVTTPSDLDAMERLRTQWKRNLQRLDTGPHEAKLFFVVGDLDEHSRRRPQHQLDALLQLNERTNDILIAHGVKDSQLGIGGSCPIVPVSSTSQKVLWAAKYAAQHYDFDYFVRLGDDSYFRVDHFLTNIAPSVPQHNLYMGFFWGPAPCANQLDNQQFKYALGMGYVFTQDVAHYVANLDARRVPLNEPEDAVVALWLSELSLNRVHDPRFHNVRRISFINRPYAHAWRPCSSDDILLHYVRGDMWDAIDDQGIMHCTEEHYGPLCPNEAECMLTTPSPQDGLDMSVWRNAMQT